MQIHSGALENLDFGGDQMGDVELSGSGKDALQAFGCVTISLVSHFGCFVQTETDTTSVMSDGCLPFLSLRMPRHALEAAFVSPRRSRVREILRLGCLSKIVDAIIRWNDILMIKTLGWPIPIDVEPRETMGAIGDAINTNETIAESVVTVGGFAARLFRSRSVFPSKVAGQWLVREHITKALCSERNGGNKRFKEAKIADATVKRIAIDVFQFLCWPFTVGVEPRESCSGCFHATDLHVAVSLSAEPSRLLPYWSPRARRTKPYKLAVDAVVRNPRFQHFVRQIIHGRTIAQPILGWIAING